MNPKLIAASALIVVALLVGAGLYLVVNHPANSFTSGASNVPYGSTQWTSDCKVIVDLSTCVTANGQTFHQSDREDSLSGNFVTRILKASYCTVTCSPSYYGCITTNETPTTTIQQCKIHQPTARLDVVLDTVIFAHALDTWSWFYPCSINSYTSFNSTAVSDYHRMNLSQPTSFRISWTQIDSIITDENGNIVKTVPQFCQDVKTSQSYNRATTSMEVISKP